MGVERTGRLVTAFFGPLDEASLSREMVRPFTEGGQSSERRLPIRDVLWPIAG